MQYYIIFDALIQETAKKILQTEAYENVAHGTGVSSFQSDQNTIFLIDPKGFSPSAFTSVTSKLSRARNLNVIAPSMIQYFASEMKTSDHIYQAIDTMAKCSPIFQKSAVFRMTNEKPQVRDNLFKHRISYSSLPKKSDTHQVSYIQRGKGLITENQLREQFNALGLNDKVERVSIPLVFHLSGFENYSLTADKYHHVPDISGEHGFDRIAYGELMLRFPSRELPEKDELDFIEKNIDAQINIQDIWDHNRTQWDLVRTEKLSFINASMPGPVKERDSIHFHKYNHIVMSNFNWAAERMGIRFQNLKYIGIPMFARNGVTIAISDGKIATNLDNPQDFEIGIQKQIKDQIQTILDTNLFVDSTEKRVLSLT